jgi:hypothetical protein
MAERVMAEAYHRRHGPSTPLPERSNAARYTRRVIRLRRASLAIAPVVALACGSVPDAREGSTDDSLDAPIAFALRDGTTVRGVPIARYEHSTWWWETANEVTFAMFDPSASSDFPGKDRSLRFVDRSQIAPSQKEPVVASTTPTSYRTFAQSRGVVLERLPLDGVAVVLVGHERWAPSRGRLRRLCRGPRAQERRRPKIANEGRAASDYAVWDSPVYLPTAGWVVDADDSAPDSIPGSIPRVRSRR